VTGAHRRSLRAFRSEPDYSRPLLELTAAQREAILDKLRILYGRRRAETTYPEVERLMKVFYAYKTPEMIADDEAFDPAERFSHEDAILITYGDLLVSPGRTPLEALGSFVRRFMRGTIDMVHILPFFPYSSDRGFAIIDYEDVDPRLGSWQQIEDLADDFRLMFDGVFNHVSSKSRWFQRFLNGRPGFEEFFIAFTTQDAIDKDRLRLILRPRTTELLTRFQTIHGPKWVWTTFGPDQIDLNFKNERVLQRVVEVLLYYVRRGADLVRLDAVTYIWHELGTRCAHLRETHALVQLLRAILDVVAPQVALVTETNVPHADNVSYFGNGRDEAQLVYNFALPPLVLHAFHTGDASVLTRWASSLTHVSESATYLNFLDSHDGIGLMGVRGLLPPDQIDLLVELAQAHGGLVSWRDEGDGTRSPYELNITWYSALNREGVGESQELQVARFMATRAIALALRGVPALYLPSLFGAKNDSGAVLSGAEPRSINRRTIDEPALFRLLDDKSSWVSQVARRARRLLKRRKTLHAFHPNAEQTVIDVSPAVFAVLRSTRDRRQRVLCLVNVTPRVQSVSVPVWTVGGRELWRDILSRRSTEARDGCLTFDLAPYDVAWLRPSSPAP
jgi:glycosidase